MKRVGCVTTDEVDKIFFEVNQLDNKGRIYRLGSLILSHASPNYSSSSSQQSRRQVFTQDLVSEIVRAQVSEHVARLTEEMERRDEEVREEAESLRSQMESFMSQCSRQPAPSSS